MNKPQYVKVEDKLYKINTDFRVAIECNSIATDKKISDYERGIAIIYKLFGEEGLECTRMDKLIELARKYISLSSNEKKELKNDFQKNYELDFEKCEGLIRSSFKFDYQYDPYELEYLHWYDFYNDLSNLSTSEFGNCCVLNRIIGILDTDVSKIKDTKHKTNVINAQKEIKEKYCVTEEKEMTEEQKESAKEFYEALGIKI